jgi:transposase
MCISTVRRVTKSACTMSRLELRPPRVIQTHVRVYRRRPGAARLRPGRPRRRPTVLLCDRGYDHDKYRRLVRQRGIKPLIARRLSEHGSGLERDGWVVERSFAWLHQRRRLLVRYDRRADIHEAFLALACCLICWRRLQNSFC